MTISPKSGSLLRTYRVGVSLREAAKKLDCDFTYLSKIETGAMKPSWKFLKRAFRIYKITEEDQILFAYQHMKNFEAFNMAIKYPL